MVGSIGKGNIVEPLILTCFGSLHNVGPLSRGKQVFFQLDSDTKPTKPTDYEVDFVGLEEK